MWNVTLHRGWLHLYHSVFFLASPPWFWWISGHKNSKVKSLADTGTWFSNTKICHCMSSGKMYPDKVNNTDKYHSRGHEVINIRLWGWDERDDKIIPEKGSCKWGDIETWDPDWRLLYRSEETGQSNKLHKQQNERDGSDDSQKIKGQMDRRMKSTYVVSEITHSFSVHYKSWCEWTTYCTHQ